MSTIPMPKSVSIEDAFAITVELFKGVQKENENLKKLFDEQNEELETAKSIINLCRYNFSQEQLSFRNGYELCARFLNKTREEDLPLYEEIK